MAINKIVYENNTLLDLTGDTATADKVLYGYTAHDRTGTVVTGTAAGETRTVKDLVELASNYANEDGFILFYNNAITGITYVTNSIVSGNGAFEETSNINLASVWYLAQVPGYTDGYYIYTKINGVNQYMYNDTGSGANFMGLSTTSKAIFIMQYASENKFYFKISTKNAWLQHSKSGGGMRLYTANTDANNSQITFIYNANAIIPYGVLEITESGTYDVYNYKTVVVNVS